jgi:hypothetical protein
VCENDLKMSDLEALACIRRLSGGFGSEGSQPLSTSRQLSRVNGFDLSGQFECVVISDDSRVEAGGLSELMEAGCFEDDARGVKATLTRHGFVLDSDTFWEDVTCEDLHSYRSEVHPHVVVRSAPRLHLHVGPCRACPIP